MLDDLVGLVVGLHRRHEPGVARFAPEHEAVHVVDAPQVLLDGIEEERVERLPGQERGRGDDVGVVLLPAEALHAHDQHPVAAGLDGGRERRVLSQRAVHEVAAPDLHGREHEGDGGGGEDVLGGGADADRGRRRGAPHLHVAVDEDARAPAGHVRARDHERRQRPRVNLRVETGPVDLLPRQRVERRRVEQAERAPVVGLPLQPGARRLEEVRHAEAVDLLDGHGLPPVPQAVRAVGAGGRDPRAVDRAHARPGHDVRARRHAEAAGQVGVEEAKHARLVRTARATTRQD